MAQNDDERAELRFTSGNDQRIQQLIRGYYSHVQALDRAGNLGVGVTNLKRAFGRPDDLKLIVDGLAEIIPAADGLAAADTGAAPLTALVAYTVRLPSVFVRTLPKTHFLSYGGEPETNHPLLSGERLPPGGNVVVIDDLLYSGETMTRAAEVLREVGLVVETAACVLTVPVENWSDRLLGAGITQVATLARTADIS